MSKVGWTVAPYSHYYCERCYDPTDVGFKDIQDFNARCITFRLRGMPVPLYLCPECVTELALTLLDLADKAPGE